MSTWTDTQLRQLALNNYFQDNVHEIRLSGDKVGEIVPFGIANVQTGFGVNPAVPMVAQAANVGGVDPLDDIDADFGTIRTGQAAQGGILGELNPRRFGARAESPVDEMLLHDLLGFEEEKEEGFLQEEKFDSDLDLFAILDEPGAIRDIREDDDARERVELMEIVEAHRRGLGRQINYANISRMGTSAFGFRRRQFFYDQLHRMRAALIHPDNIRKYQGYQLAATLSVKTTNQRYGRSAARNFGTTAQDGETRLGNFDATQWDFDIHDPLNQNPIPGTVVVTGTFVQMDSPEQFDAVIEQLIRTVDLEIRRQESDSGTLGFDGTSKHLMNMFIYKMIRPEAGGLYDVDDTEGAVQFSNKSVFTPERSERNTCFWECLFYFLVKRYLGIGEGMHTHYEGIIKPCVDKWANLSRNARRTLVIRCARQSSGLLLSLYSRAKHVRSEDLTPLPLTEIDSVLSFFGCHDDALIMDVNGEALMGDIDGAELRRVESGNFTGIWYRDHMHLVLSYTGSLIIKKCRRCDKRFATEGALRKHLDAKACLKCSCLPKTGHFETEAQWRFHMDNRISVCPRFRDDVVSTVDDDGKKKRFLHDNSENKFAKRKDREDALEKDDHPARNYQECIYFDLESVVPINNHGLSNAEHSHQQPYACGWLLRSEGLAKEEPHITYGENCIGEFFNWLDELHYTLLADEERLWYTRARTGVMLDNKARKINGKESYALRIKKSWDRHIVGLESPGCLICHEIADEGHGYFKDETEGFTFSHCAFKTYSRQVAENNFVRNFNGNAPRIPIWAHNGGKYDWVFLHRYMMENGRLDEMGRIVRSSSKYFMIPYRDIFEFKDSMNFMSGSLDRLGKDFGAETLKGIFPYRLLSTMERINLKLENEISIRASIPHAYFQVTEKLPGPMGCSIKRDMTESEYVEFFSERDWQYDVKHETIMYLKDDVKCLMQVVEKFRKGWLDMPHSPELFKFMTIGQMCHTYFLDHFLTPNMYPCLDVCEDSYIRRALYGGRTEVFRRVAPANGLIHYVDVNSLYPYVMESRDLPCGDPVWHIPTIKENIEYAAFKSSPFNLRYVEHSKEYFENVRDKLNDIEDNYELYGFFEVDVLCSLETRYPILPERRSTDGDKTFKNMFTNMSKTKMVYYSEELKRAIRSGYKVTKVYSYTQWHRGRVYGKLIEVLKAEKLKGEGKDIHGAKIPGLEKNPSLRAAAKTAQNSLFGKTIQFVDSDVSLVHTREDLFKRVSRAFSKVSIKPIFRSAVSDVVEVASKYSVPQVQKRSCAALGTAILAEARLVLYEYFDKVQDVGGEILYCDTDSIVFSGETPLGEECMHHCEYGKMKVEIDPETIHRGGFVGMSPKCYAFKLKDGAPYVRCKGVNLGQNLDMLPEERDAMADLVMEMEMEEYVEKLALPIKQGETVTKGINFDKMKRLITGETDVLVTSQLQFLKTSDRLVSAYENVKMMRSHFDKRMLGEEGETFAWNDFNMNMSRIIENRDNKSISDYLGVVGPAELHYLRKVYENSDFFNSIVAHWLRSDNVNVLYYENYLKTIDDYVIID